MVFCQRYSHPRKRSEDNSDEQPAMSESARTEETADRLLRLLPRFQRWAATTVQANRGGQDLSLRQLAVLYLIREGAAFPSELARQLRISPAVVTGLLDRLEQRGYLQPVGRRERPPPPPTGAHRRRTGRQLRRRAHAVPATSPSTSATRRPPTSSRWMRALDLLEAVVDGLERDSPRLGPVAIEDEMLGDALDQEEDAAGSSAAVG